MTIERQSTMPLTSAGRGRLQEELERLRREQEPACRERLLDLREGGNPEDLELQVVFEELARVRARIRELEHLLAAAPDDRAPHAPGTITIGSRVTARDDGGRMHVFVLVSPLEGGAVRGHVSTASPVGAALLGRQPGDEVRVTAPAGRRVFTVLGVE
jgi:transcription elongation factor GreA